MKRVLCVSPHFIPTNASDMHRIRLALPYFEEFGWQPSVLSVDANYVELARDETIAATLPSDLLISSVKALPVSWTRRFGLGNLGLRAWPFLLREGCRMLSRERYDLIYFASTVFDAIPISRYWRWRYKVPVVVDLQDPWCNDFHHFNPGTGRPAKFWIDYRIKWLTERIGMPAADGITAVSHHYIETMHQRYPILERQPSQTIPFGGSEHDLAFVKSNGVKNPLFDPLDGDLHFVFAGVVPASWDTTLCALFRAFGKGVINNSLSSRLKLHFVGTQYAPGARPRLMTMAERYGVADMVSEHAVRLPYFQAMKIMLDANLLLLLGGTDSHYIPSKLFNYLMMDKPIFAILHQLSPGISLLDKLNIGWSVPFHETMTEKELSNQIFERLNRVLTMLDKPQRVDKRQLQPYTAKGMTEKICTLFDEVLTQQTH